MGVHVLCMYNSRMHSLLFNITFISTCPGLYHLLALTKQVLYSPHPPPHPTQTYSGKMSALTAGGAYWWSKHADRGWKQRFGLGGGGGDQWLCRRVCFCWTRPCPRHWRSSDERPIRISFRWFMLIELRRGIPPHCAVRTFLSPFSRRDRERESVREIKNNPLHL